MKKLAIEIFIFFFIGIWFVVPLSAAIGDGPAGGAFGSGEETGSTLDTNTYVPIDGGIVTVTGLAIGYGLKQRRKRRNQKYNP